MHVDLTYVCMCGGSLVETLYTSDAWRYLTRVHAVTDFADFSTENPRKPPPRVYASESSSVLGPTLLWNVRMT